MKARCTNPHAKDFKNYGSRGVAFCKRWERFEEFFADMGERPPGCTLDRIDPNGDYTPGNCRWADRWAQRRNQRPRRANAAMKRRQLEPLSRSLDSPPF